jgi:hypothetical protein
VPENRPAPEYSENGHFLGGPQLAQPHALVKMQGEMADSVRDAKHALDLEAAASREMRQRLPIPDAAASTRTQRRHGLGQAGVDRHRGPRALLAALLKVA